MTGRLCRRFAAPVCTVVAPGNGTLGACPGTLQHNVLSGRAHAMTGRLCRRCVCLCARWWPRRTARSATARKSCQAVRRARPSATLGESTCNDGTFVPAVCLPPCPVVAPANGTLGNCTQELPSGETCTPECNSGYVLSGESTCNDGTFVPAVCLLRARWWPRRTVSLATARKSCQGARRAHTSCDAGFTLSGSITCDGGGTLQPAFCMPRYFTTAEFCPAWEAQIFCSFSDDAMSCSSKASVLGMATRASAYHQARC